MTSGPNPLPSHREAVFAIEEALARRNNKIACPPSLAEIAADAVLELARQQRKESHPPLRLEQQADALETKIGYHLYGAFGPRYSPGYDGPRPIDPKYFDTAKQVTAIVGRHGLAKRLADRAEAVNAR